MLKLVVVERIKSACDSSKIYCEKYAEVKDLKRHDDKLSFATVVSTGERIVAQHHIFQFVEEDIIKGFVPQKEKVLIDYKPPRKPKNNSKNNNTNNQQELF